MFAGRWRTAIGTTAHACTSTYTCPHLHSICMPQGAQGRDPCVDPNRSSCSYSGATFSAARNPRSRVSCSFSHRPTFPCYSNPNYGWWLDAHFSWHALPPDCVLSAEIPYTVDIDVFEEEEIIKVVEEVHEEIVEVHFVPCPLAWPSRRHILQAPALL